jgi:hypothetical protein
LSEAKFSFAVPLKLTSFEVRFFHIPSYMPQDNGSGFRKSISGEAPVPDFPGKAIRLKIGCCIFTVCSSL